MNNKQARYLHRVLDRLAEGKSLYSHEIEELRKSLPELPAQKTLEELRREVYDAWAGTSGNEWPDDIHGDLDNWLEELRDQLRGLVNTHPEVLETKEDYESAPEGTIVAANGSKTPIVKDDGWPVHMAVIPRRVLRWGDQ